MGRICLRQPTLIIFVLENHRHAIVDRLHELVGIGDENRERPEVLSGRSGCRPRNASENPRDPRHVGSQFRCGVCPEHVDASGRTRPGAASLPVRRPCGWRAGHLRVPLGDIGAANKDVLEAWTLAKVLHDPAASIRCTSLYATDLV